ncbi:MAG: stage III sporulation protein AE [Clostridiales bacterium]|nr:stage III sporulation protein AE [Clostridiales bacterium]
MSKTIRIIALSFAIAVLSAIFNVSVSMNAHGDGNTIGKCGLTAVRRGDDNGEGESITGSVDELLDNLDLSGLQGLVNSLGADGLKVFGFSDIADRISAVANGEFENDFGGIVSYVLALVGANIFEYMPMMLSVLAIILAYNLLNSIKGKYASESIERVVYFATGALAISLIVGYFSSILATAVKFAASVRTQVQTVAPILLTLMTAAGATSSAGVYTPTIAILGNGMTSAVTYLVFPALLMALVFDIIGSISTSVKLDKTVEFFRSACKWFLGSAFFLFVTVIGISGITASVRDGITVRAARFAVSKYVPVIGGYLSQGFDFIMAGNVLIKNAVGSSAVVLIVLLVTPILSKLVIFTLTLKLTAAIAEPLGGDRFCGVLTSVAKTSSMIATAVVALTVMYVLFLAMIICTGNIGL